MKMNCGHQPSTGDIKNSIKTSLFKQIIKEVAHFYNTKYFTTEIINFPVATRNLRNYLPT